MALHPGPLRVVHEALEQKLEGHFAARGRHALDRTSNGATNERGKRVVFGSQLVSEVGGIAAEQLIGAFAAENHLDVLAGGASEKECRQDSRIGERLRHGLNDDLQRFAERLFIIPHRNVPRADARSEDRRITALVV